MVRTVQHHVQHQLLILHGVLWELLRSCSTLKRHYRKERKHVSPTGVVCVKERKALSKRLLTDLLKMITDVRGENRFDDDLTHVPVLSLTQKLKDIVLGVQEQFKGYGAVMVL